MIEQRNIGWDVNTFMDGLKNMLDEDIDAVFIDSLHEKGAEEVVLELAESGKLIILVMDADTVVSALDRFINNISASYAASFDYPISPPQGELLASVIKIE